MPNTKGSKKLRENPGQRNQNRMLSTTTRCISTYVQPVDPMYRVITKERTTENSGRLTTVRAIDFLQKSVMKK